MSITPRGAPTGVISTSLRRERPAASSDRDCGHPAAPALDAQAVRLALAEALRALDRLHTQILEANRLIGPSALPGYAPHRPSTSSVEGAYPDAFSALLEELHGEGRAVVHAMMSEMPGEVREQLPLYLQAALDSAVAKGVSGDGEKVRDASAYRRGSLVAMAREWTRGGRDRVIARMQEVLGLRLEPPIEMSRHAHSCSSYDCPECGPKWARGADGYESPI